MKSAFENVAAAGARTKGGRFSNYIESRFGAETLREISRVFKKLRLPLPKEEFLGGTEGALIFLNPYGMVLRIEAREGEMTRAGIGRVDDSAWVLRPVASISAGKAVIELCPGCKMNGEYKDAMTVHGKLAREGIDFWDLGILGDATRNIGMMPIKMPGFPKGVPVVVDRLAVARLSAGAADVRRKLTAADPQERLYGPIRRLFEKVWLEEVKPENITEFWLKCCQAKEQGKLVPGWNEYYGDDDKSRAASKIAASYEKLMTRKFSPVTATALK